MPATRVPYNKPRPSLTPQYFEDVLLEFTRKRKAITYQKRHQATTFYRKGNGFLNPTQPLFKCVDCRHVVTAYDMQQLFFSQAPATTDENRDFHIISVSETQTQTDIHVNSSLALQELYQMLQTLPSQLAHARREISNLSQQLQEQSESHQHHPADNDAMDFPISDFSTQT
ncbi:hypothetical protein G6F43_000187 [Rhizopus delemar]|nr:hypothetical protein G6F43_000187 [Rhizopus delemar]